MTGNGPGFEAVLQTITSINPGGIEQAPADVIDPLAVALHDAFFDTEGRGLMGMDLWRAMAASFLRRDPAPIPTGLRTGPVAANRCRETAGHHPPHLWPGAVTGLAYWCDGENGEQINRGAKNSAADRRSTMTPPV